MEPLLIPPPQVEEPEGLSGEFLPPRGVYSRLFVGTNVKDKLAGFLSWVNVLEAHIQKVKLPDGADAILLKYRRG